MISLNRVLTSRMYSPFRAYILDNVFDPDLYQRLMAAFPGPEHFHRLAGIGLKDTFNERSAGFHEFMEATPVWRDVYEWFRAAAPHVLASLDAEEVEGIKTVKFEFSSLPSPGGFLPPHTDTPKKLATVVLYFTDARWPEAWGGSTDFYAHKHRPDGDFTAWPDLSLVDLDLILRADYLPNRAVGLVRTNNSLHGVPPVFHPQDLPRRSVTVNFLA